MAVAQLAYHPALDGHTHDPLADPLFAPTAASSSLRATPLPPALDQRLRTLEERIRGVYSKHLRAKLRAICAACSHWGVDILVFPEAAIPRELLPDLGELELASIISDHPAVDSDLSVYETIEQFKTPIDRPRGRTTLIVRSHELLGMRGVDDPQGFQWQGISIGNGGVKIGVLTVDELVRRARQSAPDSLPPKPTDHVLAVLGGADPAANRMIEGSSSRWNCPVLFASSAMVGGSQIFAGEGAMMADPHTYLAPLAPGEEGVLVVSLELSADRPYIVEFEAAASLVHSAHPATAAYVDWYEEWYQSARHWFRGNEDLPKLRTSIGQAWRILHDVGALPEAPTRSQRIRHIEANLSAFTRARTLVALTREVLLPRTVLPFAQLRGALALAAERQIEAWARASGDGTLRATLEHLRAAIAAEGVETDPRTDHVRDALAELERAIVQPLAEEVVADPAPIPRRERIYGEGKLRVDLLAVDELLSAEGRPSSGDQIRVLEEAILWLTVDGVSAMRIVAAALPKGASFVGIVGRVAGGWYVWWPTGHGQGEPAVAAAVQAGLACRLPGITARPLDLEDLRAGLPELQASFAGFAPRVADERAARLAHVGGQFLSPYARLAELQTPASALALLDEWAQSDERIALLVGDGGMGKSTLLLEWTLRRWRAGAWPLPVRLHMPSPYDPRGALTVLLDQAGLADTPAHRAALRLLLRHRVLAPVLDDFDALSASRGAIGIMRLLNELLHAIGDGHILVASRGGASSDQLREVAASIHAIHLEPLALAQVIDLVRRVRPDASERFARLAASREIGEFIRVPLLLGLVLKILDHIDPTVDLARADLFDLCAESWLRQADAASVAAAEELALVLWRLGDDLCPIKEFPGIEALPEGASLLVVDDTSVRFIHRAFAEFFLARALVRHMPARTRELLATGDVHTGLLDLIAHQLRRRTDDPQTSPFVRALTTWLRTGPDDPTIPRDEQRVCSSRAALYLHGVGSRLDSARQWIPRGANLVHTNLADCDLRGVRLVGVQLDAAELHRADLSDAVLRDASLVRASLSGARLDHTDLRAANLRTAWLDGAEGDRCDFREADLRGASLRNSTWTECRWTGARIEPNDGSLWLNIKGTGTPLGVTLPGVWRLSSSANSPPSLDCLTYSADGRFLAAILGGLAYLVDPVEGVVRELGAHCTLFRWAAEGSRFAYRDREARVHVGDLRGGLTPAGPLPVELLARMVLSLDWRPGDDYPLLLTRRGVEARAAPPGEWQVLTKLPPLADFSGVQFHQARLLWSARGALIIGHFDGALHYYPSVGDPSMIINHGSGTLTQVRLSPTGDFLALDSSATAALVDLRDPARPRVYPLQDDVEAMAWLPAGNMLAYTRKGDYLTQFDAERRVAVMDRPLAVHNDSLLFSHTISAITWRADGARFAVASSKCCVRIEGPDNDLVCELFVHPGEHAIAVPGGCFALSDPDSRRYHVEAGFESYSHKFPLGGLRRVLHRPDVVRAALRGEDPLVTAAELLADLGWREPPGTFDDDADAVILTNPFLASRPLDGPDLPGRAHVLGELEALIDQRAPVLIKGPRRGGKTSTLHALEARQGRRRAVRRVSLAGSSPRRPDDLARLLDPAVRDEPNAADALVRRLERDRADPPVLLLDEIAWLVEGDQQLFAWLRMLGQEGLARLVLAGSHGDWVDIIKAANRMPGSSFGNDFTIVELMPLAEDDAIQFLVATAPPDVPIHPARTAAWILEACGTWPFYLQVMGYAVVEEVRAGHRRPLVDRYALRELYERRLLRERLAVFRSRWSDLRRPAQDLLLSELEQARAAGREGLTPYRDLSRPARTIFSDAGLIDAARGWTLDRPFRDWLHRNLDELEPSDA